MIGGQDGTEGAPLAEINITPLVDVMLVLLVIFMVTAPLLLPQSLGIELPRTAALPAKPAEARSRLLIDREGQLQLDGSPVAASELAARLADKARDPAHTLAIEADENVRYGRVAEVLALARAAGQSRIAFVTVRAGPAQPPSAR